jgi:heme exporter protein C
MIWAKFTWGAYWVNDPKLNGAAVTLLIYFAYLILRGSLEEEQKRAKVSAVYNIFAYVMLLVFLMIWPRMNGVDSLHPGNGGNPAFSSYDLDSNMRLVFYPAIIGWTLIGVWMMTLRVRIRKIQQQLLNN